MAGAFDDLIPSAAPAAGASGGAFDDLLPAQGDAVQALGDNTPASQRGVQRFVQGVTEAASAVGVPPKSANMYARYLAGLGRGVTDVTETGQRLINSAAPFLVRKDEEYFQNNLTGRRQFDQGDAGGVGRFLGQQAAITAPAMLVGMGANALTAPAMRLLPAAVQPGAPTLLGGAAGAVPWLASKAVEGGASGLVSNVLAGEGGENVGKDALEGATTGAIFNPALSTVLATPRIAGWMAGQIGPAASQRAGQLALEAERMGIPVRGAQVSDSEFMKRADALANKVPLSGYAGRDAEAATAFNRAVARTFGENADTITPDVLSAARTRIGGEMNRIARSTPVQYDNALHNRLAGIENDLLQVVSDSEARPLLNQLQNVLGKVGQNNEIDGRAFAALIKKGSPLDNALSSPNANIRQYAGQIRNALDDAFERSAPQDVAEAWRAARSQYKAMMTVKNIADFEGDISAPRLMAKVRQSYKDSPFTGTGNDLDALGSIGQRFLKPPSSSGSAENWGVLSLLASIPGGLMLYAQNPQAAMKAAAAAAAGALGTRGATGVLGSNAYRDAAVARALGQPMPAGPNAAFNNALTRGMTPFVVPNVREGVPAQ